MGGRVLGVVGLLGLWLGAPAGASHVIAIYGDSVSDSADLGMSGDMEWPERLAAMINQLAPGPGGDVVVRNYSRDGSKTGPQSPGWVYRGNEQAWMGPPPDLAIVYGGFNDIRVPTTITRSGTTATVTSAGHGYVNGDVVTITGCSPSVYNVVAATVAGAATNTFTVAIASDPGVDATVPAGALIQLQTTDNLRSIGLMVKFGCRGFVAGQASLPAQGSEGERYLVQSDTSSTGGVADVALQAWRHARLGGVVTGQTVWEYRAGGAGESGWARIASSATAADRCARVLYAGCQYLDYSASAGDTLAAAYVPYDDRVGLRRNHVDAAALEGGLRNPGVGYCDVYGAIRSMVASGQLTAGTFQLQVGDGNIHLNSWGQDVVAQAIYGRIAVLYGFGWAKGVGQ